MSAKMNEITPDCEPETENSPSEEKTENSPPEEKTGKEIPSPAKGKNNQGIRLIRGRMYDSKNGKSCHQCRQKTLDVFAACKIQNPRTNKPCTFNFCHKCLSNRYGEKAEVVGALPDWVCPKCRGICNCSVCMKKHGHQPTGMLVHSAKKKGFLSVTELLQNGEAYDGQGENLASKRAASEMVPVYNSPRKRFKENDFDGEINNNLSASTSPSNLAQDSNAEISLPEGFELCSIHDTDIPPRDVGQAFQFLEFCAVFGEMLGVRKGQPEVVLRDLMQGRTIRRGEHSGAVYFIVKMLFILQTEREEGSSEAELMEGDSWIKVLNEHISETGNFVNRVDAFEFMDSSEKLRVVNFLCDEILGTAKIRDWIDEKMKEDKAAKNEHKEKVLAIKNKEKSLKQQMQDEIAKAMLEKNDAIVSKIRREVAAAQTELAGLNGLPYKKNKYSEILRAEPVHVGIDGRAYWKLKCMANNSGSDILQQDVVRTGENSAQDEKWFGFDDGQREVIEKRINSLGLKRFKRC